MWYRIIILCNIGSGIERNKLINYSAQVSTLPVRLMITKQEMYTLYSSVMCIVYRQSCGALSRPVFSSPTPAPLKRRLSTIFNNTPPSLLQKILFYDNQLLINVGTNEEKRVQNLFFFISAGASWSRSREPDQTGSTTLIRTVKLALSVPINRLIRNQIADGLLKDIHVNCLVFFLDFCQF